MNDLEKFDYSYSAPTERERREIEDIKKQYVTPKKEEGLAKLRKLNNRVIQPPLIVSLMIGIVGTLIMGTGMAMALEWNLLAWGIVVGVLGLAIAAVAYPIYRAILKRNKQKYGRQIIDLSNELLHEENK